LNRLNLVILGTKILWKPIYKKIGFDTSIRGSDTNPYIIFFRNEGSRIALYPIERLAGDVNEKNPPAISAGFLGITLAYNAKSVKEVDDIMERVKSAGATI